MKTIKTKKELLDVIQKCYDGKHIKDDDKKKAFDEQVKSLKDVLVGLSDSVEFPQYNSLTFENSFCDFVIVANVVELQDRLKLIYHDLYEFAKNYIENQKKIIITRDNVLKGKSLSRKIFFWIMISIIGIALTVTLVLAVMQWVTPNESVNNQWDWIALAGILDAFIGGIGFIIERVLDHKNNDVFFEAEDAIKTNNPDNYNLKYVKQKAKKIVNNDIHDNGHLTINQ